MIKTYTNDFKKQKKYSLLKAKIEKLISEGRFYRLQRKTRFYLINKLRKLHNALFPKHTSLKYAATASLLLSVCISAEAQDGFTPNPEQNPFPVALSAGSFTRPVMVDLNGNGRMDIFAGNSEGRIVYLINDGNGKFVEQTGEDNPFDDINLSATTDIAFSDLDDDGDLDAVIVADGEIYTYINNGQNEFSLATEEDDPFSDIIIDEDVAFTLADWDNDGDDDAFFGDKEGGIRYFENVEGVFTERFNENNPLNDVEVTTIIPGENPITDLAFADIDGDGDLDAFIGGKYGDLVYYENEDGDFTESEDLPININYYAHGMNISPGFGDINNNGEIDALLGNFDYYFHHYENDGDGTLDYVNPSQSPIGGGFALATANDVVFFDYNNDGHKDAFVGGSRSALMLYKNQGDNTFIEAFEENPFLGIEFDCERPTINFVDIDGDGDQDAFVACEAGVTFFRNSGGIFEEETFPGNPFEGLGLPEDFDEEEDDESNFERPVSITFYDFDGDGDLDAMIPLVDDGIAYFENASGSFTRKENEENPLDDFSHLSVTNIKFFDIDQDGDADIFLGTSYGQIIAFENTDGEFEENFNPEFNPFEDLQLEAWAYLTFDDFDKDGNINAFVGGWRSILFYESEGYEVEPEDPTEPTEPEGPASSIDKLQSLSLKLYPNPASSVVYLSGNISSSVQYQILNSHGAKVSEGSGTTIPLHNLKPGLYIVHVVDGEKIGIQQLVVN
ncbi:MAG: FG-GAP-like repeat-containing protein [Cytophagaceae bacterium]